MTDPLTTAVVAMATRPFVWGQCDCCLAVCDVLVALGLPDPAIGWRGRYEDQGEAAVLLEMAGGLPALAGTACASLGWPAIHPAQARPGDMGVIAAPEPALAVFDGGWWCAKSPRGLLRRRTARQAWATGYV